jgi:hypothetical protein
MEPIGFAPAPKNRQQRRAAKSNPKTSDFKWPDMWDPDNLELLSRMFLMHINQIPGGIERFTVVLDAMKEEAKDEVVS